eukprot:236314-Chlamydomonas_euryale.AAC.1
MAAIRERYAQEQVWLMHAPPATCVLQGPAIFPLPLPPPGPPPSTFPASRLIHALSATSSWEHLKALSSASVVQHPTNSLP